LKLSKLVAWPADEVASELTPELAFRENTGFTVGGTAVCSNSAEMVRCTVTAVSFAAVAAHVATKKVAQLASKKRFGSSSGLSSI
jgi:hypothetical protein